MRRTNYWTAAILMTSVILPLLTSGCSRDNPLANDSGRTALLRAAVGNPGLPEIVVSAPRQDSQTIAMSDRNVSAAEDTAPARARRP
jgi:hypothetical protein